MDSKTCSVDGCEQPHYGRGWCKPHYQAEWRRSHPGYRREWYLTHYEQSREKARQWNKANAERNSVTERERRTGENREKYNARMRHHNANRRAQKLAAKGKFSLGEWRALCEQYGHRCLCCGLGFQLHADHVVPLSEGGSNGIDNIQPLCKSCNSRKWKSIIDYRPTLP